MKPLLHFFLTYMLLLAALIGMAILLLFPKLLDRIKGCWWESDIDIDDH